MPNDLGTAIRDEFAKLLEPVSLAAGVEDGPAVLVRLAGHVGSLGRDPGLQAELERLAGLVDDLGQLSDADLGSWGGIAQVLEAVSDLVDAVESIGSMLDDPELRSRARDLGREILEQLVALYLRTHRPSLFRAAALLTVITRAEGIALEPMEVDDDGEVTRLARARDEVHTERVRDVFADVPGLLRSGYLPGDLRQAKDAHLAAARLFPHLVDLAQARQLRWTSELQRVGEEIDRPDGQAEPDEDHFGSDPEAGHPVEEEPDLSDFYRDHRPRFAVHLPPADDGDAPEDPGVDRRVGLEVAASSAEHPGGAPGFAVAALGELAWRAERDGWSVELRSDGSVPAFVVGPDGIVVDSDPGARAEASLFAARSASPDAPPFHLGPSTGTRIELRGLRIAAELRLADDAHFGVLAGTEAAELVIAAADGDGFLRRVLPEEDLRIPFDLGLGWSSRTGTHLRGSAGLEATLPARASAGPLSVERVTVALFADEVGLRAEASATVGLTLGPVALTLDRVGLRSAVDLVAGEDSVGPPFNFKPPAGVGVAVDAGPVSGGGYLSFDPERERYAGGVKLDAAGIALNAVGLLTTRGPGVADGYSLLVLVSAADFAPVNLGFGFTLNGVGGLLGVNRAVDVDELRGRLRGGGLDRVLFPDDPAGEADELAGQLRSTFPPEPDRHLVGPAALIGWGTPTVLTVELVVALELPEPVRLVALALLRARLPSEHRALVRLNMDAVGVVDFDAGRVSLDAVLYDSRVAAYAIDGEVALRARWLGNPGFVLAAGGLNPRYQPPPDFPDLEPLSMRLERGRAKLRLEAYLALTSNTVQVGARLTVEVGVGRFNIDGGLRFDALFEFAPFGFVADFAGGVRVRWGSRTLLGVHMEMTLSGPAPMHARGSATIEVWRFSYSVGFDVTLDRGDPPPPLPPADPLPDLLAAFEAPGNWSAALPRDDRSIVSLRDAGRPGLALVHPLGELTVRQRVLPLEVEIARYGSRRLAGGPRAFDVTVSLTDGAPVEPRTVDDHFAPAQFFELDDHDALSAPAFERLPSGVRLEIADAVFGGQDDAGLMTCAPVGHRTRVIDADGAARDAAVSEASAAKVRSATARRRSALPAPGHAGGAKYRGPDLEVRAREPVYVVARVADLRVESFADAGGSEGLSHTVATQLRRAQERDGRSGLQVVARHEAIGALPGLLSPGMSPEEPGIYEERGSFGSRVPGARRVTMTPESDPLPPTQAPGRRWQWVAPLEDAG